MRHFKKTAFEITSDFRLPYTTTRNAETFSAFSLTLFMKYVEFRRTVHPGIGRVSSIVYCVDKESRVETRGFENITAVVWHAYDHCMGYLTRVVTGVGHSNRYSPTCLFVDK